MSTYTVRTLFFITCMNKSEVYDFANRYDYAFDDIGDSWVITTPNVNIFISRNLDTPEYNSELSKWETDIQIRNYLNDLYEQSMAEIVSNESSDQYRISKGNATLSFITSLFDSEKFDINHGMVCDIIDIIINKIGAYHIINYLKTIPHDHITLIDVYNRLGIKNMNEYSGRQISRNPFGYTEVVYEKDAPIFGEKYTNNS